MAADKKKAKTYLINDVANTVGLSQKRIREYEKEGLVNPVRAPRTNNRVYVDSDIERIQRIKQLIHEHGFTLSCLKYFLTAAPCWIIYDCTEKKSCPAYQTPHTVCFKIVQAADPSRAERCKRCSVYVNRNQKNFPLFNRSE
jgi:hypothetical protein